MSKKEEKKEQPLLLTTTPALIGSIVEVLFPSHAEKLQSECIEESALVVEISDPGDQTIGASVAAKLKGFLDQLEESRKIVKQPYWDAGVAIDDFVKTKRIAVASEFTRIKGLLGGYDEKERLRVAAELQAAENERLRLQKEKEDNERAEQKRLADLEAIRVAAEAAAKAATDAPAIAAAKAQAEAARAEIDAAAFAADFAEPEPAPEPVYVAPVSVASGVSVKPVYDFEVTDIHALYAAFPHLVKLEPRTAQIKSYINAGGLVDPANIPGLRCWNSSNVRVQSARPVVKAIEE